MLGILINYSFPFGYFQGRLLLVSGAGHISQGFIGPWTLEKKTEKTSNVRRRDRLGTPGGYVCIYTHYVYVNVYAHYVYVNVYTHYVYVYVDVYLKIKYLMLFHLCKTKSRNNPRNSIAFQLHIHITITHKSQIIHVFRVCWWIIFLVVQLTSSVLTRDQ